MLRTRTTLRRSLRLIGTIAGTTVTAPSSAPRQYDAFVSETSMGGRVASARDQRGYGATAARLTADQKVRSFSLSGLICSRQHWPCAGCQRAARAALIFQRPACRQSYVRLLAPAAALLRMRGDVCAQWKNYRTRSRTWVVAATTRRPNH